MLAKSKQAPKHFAGGEMLAKMELLWKNVILKLKTTISQSMPSYSAYRSEWIKAIVGDRNSNLISFLLAG